MVRLSEVFSRSLWIHLVHLREFSIEKIMHGLKGNARWCVTRSCSSCQKLSSIVIPLRFSRWVDRDLWEDLTSAWWHCIWSCFSCPGALVCDALWDPWVLAWDPKSNLSWESFSGWSRYRSSSSSAPRSSIDGMVTMFLGTSAWGPAPCRTLSSTGAVEDALLGELVVPADKRLWATRQGNKGACWDNLLARLTFSSRLLLLAPDLSLERTRIQSKRTMAQSKRMETRL